MTAKIKTFISVLTVLAALAGCRRTDVRDFAVEIPGATEADMPAISKSLEPYAGVERDSLRFDVAKHVLTLRYDSMQLAKKNIEMAIAAIGFTANGVTPESIGKASRK